MNLASIQGSSSGVQEPATTVAVNHSTNDGVVHSFRERFVKVSPVPRRRLLSERVLLKGLNSVKVNYTPAASDVTHFDRVDCTTVVARRYTKTVFRNVFEKFTQSRTWVQTREHFRAFVPVGCNDQTFRWMRWDTNSSIRVVLREPRSITKSE